MSFLMLIPGLFELLEKVIGPLLSSTAGASSKIAGGLLGIASNPTVSGILGVVEGAVGKLQDEQIVAIKSQTTLMLAQLDAVKDDTQSASIFGSWHAFFCWSMALITVTHFAMAELFNLLIALHVANVGIIAPLDTATLFFIGSVLGITMAGKTVERVNSNTSEDS